MKPHLFKSINEDRVIEIGEYDNGFYYIEAAQGKVPDEQNVFQSIEEIEHVLDDTLVLMRIQDS